MTPLPSLGPTDPTCDDCGAQGFRLNDYISRGRSSRLCDGCLDYWKNARQDEQGEPG